MAALSKIIFGDKNFKSATPWGPWMAFFAAVGFFVIQIAVTIVAGVILALVFFGRDFFSNGVPSDEMALLIDPGIVSFGIGYIVAFLVVLFAASRRGGKISEVLLFKWPHNFAGNLVLGVLAIGLFFVGLSVIIEQFFPQDAAQSQVQMKQIFGALRESKFLWLGICIVVIGAPFLEEAIFRGFLLTSFANTPLGYGGAAVVSSALWALMHGYAASMAVGLFIFGLLLSLLVRRSGSIWIAIGLHGLWNAVVTAGVFASLAAQ